MSLCVGALAGVVTACGGAGSPAPATPAAQLASDASIASWVPRVQRLDVSSGQDSTAPQLTVNAHGVVLSWVDRDQDADSVRFSEWRDARWTPPRTLVTSADLFVNAADVPSVMRVSDTFIVGHWLQNTEPELEAYDLRLAWSRDDGATWSAPITPHHDGKQVQHGFASFFAGPKATWGLVWLDGRRTDPHAMHRTPPGELGDMDLMAASFDDGGKQLSETQVDARVCDCCPTAVAATSSGPLVAFRDRSPAEDRDIAVSQLTNGSWTAPTPVAADGWRIEACPINGPAVDAVGDRVVVAWFTAAAGRGRVQAAFSSDGGRSFAPPLVVAEQDVRGRVDAVMLEDGTAAVTYVAVQDEQSRLVLERVAPSGAQSTALNVAGGQVELLGYPKLARAGTALVLAWAENQGFSRVVSAVVETSRESR